MDNLSFLPLTVAVGVATVAVGVAIYLSIDLQRKQRRIRELVDRFSRISTAVGRSHRFRRFRIVFDERVLRELNREITAIERTLGIYTPDRLRRFTSLSDKLLDALEQRIAHLEEVGSTQNRPPMDGSSVQN